MKRRVPPSVMAQDQGDDWVLYNGDAAEVLPMLPAASIDFACYSPPFSSTYTYSPSDRDLGNVRSDAEFFEQASFITREVLRLMRPGRIVATHVANLPLYETKDGVSGRRDFRGAWIAHMVEHGFVYHSEITIGKNPQAAAIRTHSKGLMFVQLKRDRSWMWQAYADYLCIFRTPGRNEVPVTTDEVTEEDWIRWARPVWDDIRETDVLSTHQARDNDDERHLCPLQLPVIERAVRLWSNRGDTVLSPFAGIGSEGVGALRHGRRFVGVELKPSYFKVAAQNLRDAAAARAARLFDEGGGHG